MSALRDSDWICKRCGSSDIIAEVEINMPSAELGGRIRERDGKPYFDESFRDLDDLDFRHNYDVVAYVCECGESASSIAKLVVRRRAFNELRLPCGRYDHHAHEHPQVGKLSREAEKRGHTRAPMPCTVAGCDCHDYYDTALGLEPNWNAPQQETLVAA